MNFLLAIFWAFATLTLLILAKKKGFFVMPRHDPFWDIPIRWFHTAGAFGLYFATNFLMGHFILSNLPLSPGISAAVWINFFASSLITATLLVYGLKIIQPIFLKIWRFSASPHLLADCQFALFSLILALPLAMCIDEGWNFILTHWFSITILPDQLAVRFVKMTFSNPLYFFFSSITIVLLAPLVEEILFRGFFQSLLRQYLGVQWAIIGTAVCFSLFHYSPEQGAANFSIISSLFVLALFLGFVYEKKRSLAASLCLHASFNAVNVINLYFFG